MVAERGLPDAKCSPELCSLCRIGSEKFASRAYVCECQNYTIFLGQNYLCNAESPTFGIFEELKDVAEEFQPHIYLPIIYKLYAI